MDKISFAFTTGILKDEDLLFWLQFSSSHDNWRKAYESTAFFERLFPTKALVNTQYKPWLIVIRNKMLQIEEEQSLMLTSLRAHNRLCALILCVIKWLVLPKHRNLLAWLLHFLFVEDSGDTKKPFLFLHGAPNSGKTFFMNILTPQNSDFLLRSRTFAHFGAEKGGDYELHLLLFDDPGDAKGKNHQLDASVILNLANKNFSQSLPVKFGFMNLKKGQIAIISNRKANLMFPQDSVEAVKTRLLEVEFTVERPFPLKGESYLANPFDFQELDLEDYSDARNEEIREDAQEEEEEEDSEEEEEGGPSSYLVQETFHPDILFYILWRAIFKILKTQLLDQNLSTLRYYVPSKILRKLIRRRDIDSIYEIICIKLSEKELLNVLTKKL